jgi:hypothetical protein
MGKIQITIEIDDSRLASHSDKQLALLWHVAQANPADQFEDQTAGQLVERIGREIIRRWLKATEPELSHHQGRHYYWKQLCKFARYEPGSPDPSNPEWHHGVWVPRTEGHSVDPN